MSSSLITTIFTDDAKISDKEIILFFTRSKSMGMDGILKALLDSRHTPKKCWLLIILECSRRESNIKMSINACIKTIDLMDKQEFDVNLWIDILHQLISKDNESLSGRLRRISISHPFSALISVVMGMNQEFVALAVMLLLLKTSRLVTDLSFTNEFIERAVTLAKNQGRTFELILVKSVHCKHQRFWNAFLNDGNNHQLMDEQVCATLYKHLDHLSIQKEWIPCLDVSLEHVSIVALKMMTRVRPRVQFQEPRHSVDEQHSQRHRHQLRLHTDLD